MAAPINSVGDWFNMLDHEDEDDQDVIFQLLKSLDCVYPGTKMINMHDRQQCINLFTAIRMHQLKHTRLPGDK